MKSNSINKKKYKKSKDADKAFGVKKPFIDIAKNECCWPIGDPQDDDFGFCGAERERGSYCKRHAKIAYQPRAEKIK